MARRPLGFKPSLREQRLQMASIKPKRERAAPVQREAPVVAAISELLAVHPRVLWAARFNSGMASYEAKTGRYAPVWFHKFLRMPEPMKMPDIFGLTLEKHTCGLWTRPIAVEVKAPGFTKPRDLREREQAAFLEMIRSAGGIALFATSADEVAEALK